MNNEEPAYRPIWVNGDLRYWSFRSVADDHSGRRSYAYTVGIGTVHRPMNAFSMFCKIHRPTVRNHYPNLEHRWGSLFEFFSIKRDIWNIAILYTFINVYDVWIIYLWFANFQCNYEDLGGLVGDIRGRRDTSIHGIGRGCKLLLSLCTANAWTVCVISSMFLVLHSRSFWCKSEFRMAHPTGCCSAVEASGKKHRCLQCCQLRVSGGWAWSTNCWLEPFNIRRWTTNVTGKSIFPSVCFFSKDTVGIRKKSGTPRAPILISVIFLCSCSYVNGGVNEPDEVSTNNT